MDLFFNPNYAKVYENIEGNSNTFTFECPYGRISHTFLLREIPWRIKDEIYYDIVTPYGYGGPLAEEVKDIRLLMQAYKEAFTSYCLEHHIVCEFIRFHLFDNVDVREHYYGKTIRRLDSIVVNTSEDYATTIWMKYAHKVRKNVKKSLRNGLEIIIEHNLDHLKDFLLIYYKTMDRNNALAYYYFKDDYFRKISMLLHDNFVFFHVVKDEIVISTELVLYSSDYAYSFLGGTLSEYYELRPNDFLKNEVIKWCYDHHIGKFVLGGGYQKNDGIYKFKRSFTTDPEIPFYVGEYIFNQEAYDMVVETRACEERKSLHSDYFPVYRAF